MEKDFVQSYHYESLCSRHWSLRNSCILTACEWQLVWMFPWCLLVIYLGRSLHKSLIQKCSMWCASSQEGDRLRTVKRGHFCSHPFMQINFMTLALKVSHQHRNTATTLEMTLTSVLCQSKVNCKWKAICGGSLWTRQTDACWQSWQLHICHQRIFGGARTSY